MPPVILDEFYGLGRVVDALLCNGSIEHIPPLLRYGGLLVPIAPDDDGFRVGSRKYGSFVIGEKTLELLLCPERNAIAPVKIAASALRILVKADLAPFLGGEITIERIAFPELPQRNLGAEPDAPLPQAPQWPQAQKSPGTLPVGCNACGATTVKGPPLTAQPMPSAVIHTKGTYGHRQIERVPSSRTASIRALPWKSPWRVV